MVKVLHPFETFLRGVINKKINRVKEKPILMFRSLGSLRNVFVFSCANIVTKGFS